MRTNIDVDASKIITEDKTIEELGEDLWKELRETINGKFTKAEKFGHNNIGIRRHMAFPFPI